MKIEDLKVAYFIGIGGIGMSALARYFNYKGIEVFGYDLVETKLTKKLVNEGIKIHYEENIEWIPEQIDIVVYTPAIPSEHLEMCYLEKQGHKLWKRSEVLGLICKEMETVAIAGTHGKTSTCSLLSFIADSLDFDHAAFLGGIVKNSLSNFRFGNDLAIVEADEYDRSFLQLYPHIAAITSMDADHLDIYEDYGKMINGFEQFCLQVKEGGKVILKHGLRSKFEPKFFEKLASKNIDILEYGHPDSNCYLTIENQENWKTFISGQCLGERLIGFWNIPGKHNLENASLVFLILKLLNLDLEKAMDELSNYLGVSRRFERVAENEGRVLIDDYAHHPEELKATIKAVKELYPTKKITGIFQPHLYSRTLEHYKAFARELDLLDEIFILPIYPAREQAIKGVNSEMIINEMENKHSYAIKHDELINFVIKDKKEIIITLGAGNLEKHHPGIIDHLYT